MKRSIFYIFVGLILSTAFFSCNGQKKPVNGRTDTPTSGTISFVSDESFSPIVEELRQQFEFDYPKAHLKPIYTDEITGLNMIRDLKTCLLITSRALKPSELAYLKSKNQVPSVFPIGYDGLALIVNPNNSDTCIEDEFNHQIYLISRENELVIDFVFKDLTAKACSQMMNNLFIPLHDYIHRINFFNQSGKNPTSFYYGDDY